MREKIIAGLITISILLGFTGCSKFGVTTLPGKNEKATIDNQLEILLEAIEDEDVDAIIDMFSEEALDEIKKKHKMDEFEESIETLIATFPDWDGDYDGYNDMTVREEGHLSKNRTGWRCYEPDIDFTVDGVDYELHIVMVYHANEEERVGLRVIQLCHADTSDYVTAGYYSKPGLEVFPGVYCWDCPIAKRSKKYK